MKDGIYINDQWYSRKKICREGWDPEELDQGIVSFLKSWYDSKDYFEAHTSGSTGSPKVIRLNKSYAAASARATLDHLSLKPGDSALLALPTEYIAGRMMLTRTLIGQLHLYTTLPSAPPELPNRRIDFAAFTPHQFLSTIESVEDMKNTQIENIILGGSPVPEKMLDLAAGFEGKIFETFGMTETYSHIAIRPVFPVYSPYFEAVPGVTFQVNNDSLVIRAPHLGIDFLETNDRVELRDSRRFEWLGRNDFVINSGGIKLFPEKIEQKLADYIKEPFFIAGIPDPQLGEKVVMVVKKDQNQKDLFWNGIFAKILSKYEKPKSILYVHRIARTATGKINRPATLKEDNIFHE